MKTVILISMISEQLPGKMYNWISKNEPSKKQIEKMILEIEEELNLSRSLHYKDFKQTNGRSKLYTYLLDEESCSVLVERRDLIEFTK